MDIQDNKTKQYHDKKLESQLTDADNPLAEQIQPDSEKELPAQTPPSLIELEFVSDSAPLQPQRAAEATADLDAGPTLAENPDAQQILEHDIEDQKSQQIDAAEITEGEPLEPEEYHATFETVIEAILFASDEPLTDKKLAEIAQAGSPKRVRETIQQLNQKYKAGGFAFRIEKIAGGYQMMTLPVFHPWISKLITVRQDNKLSPAALETLAVIAYKQPIIRADIEAIRGVACGEVIRSLMYKGLVKIVGRAEVLGRPILYGTTKKFLDVFGLASLDDLPKIEELKSPDKS